MRSVLKRTTWRTKGGDTLLPMLLMMQVLLLLTITVRCCQSIIYIVYAVLTLFRTIGDEERLEKDDVEDQGGRYPAAHVADDADNITSASPVDRFVPSFMVSDMSITIEVGGVTQTFVRKRFKMDAGNSVLQLYIDLEFLDKSPLLFPYMILSAHFNRSTKQLALSMTVVRDKRGLKYVAVCILRTKCTKPRYDVLLYKISDGNCFRVTGVKKFRDEYDYLFDEEFDPFIVRDAAILYFHEQGLVYDPRGGGPNKDESGKPCVDGTENPFGTVRRR